MGTLGTLAKEAWLGVGCWDQQPDFLERCRPVKSVPSPVVCKVKRSLKLFEGFEICHYLSCCLNAVGHTHSLVDCAGLSLEKRPAVAAQEQVFLQQLYMETPEDGYWI